MSPVERIHCCEDDDTVITRESFKSIIASNTHDFLIFKFSATWCGPCEKLAPILDKYISQIESNTKHSTKTLKVYHVDVDDCFDIYAFLKSKKRVSGIPSLFFYFPREDRDIDHYYIPDASTSGIDEPFMQKMFDEISKRL